jgi:hypothetical protein
LRLGSGIFRLYGNHRTAIEVQLRLVFFRFFRLRTGQITGETGQKPDGKDSDRCAGAEDNDDHRRSFDEVGEPSERSPRHAVDYKPGPSPAS